MKQRALLLFFIRMQILMGVYALLRATFLFVHSEQYDGHDVSTLLTSFLYGLRFDSAALAWINALFIILTFLPTRWAHWERGLFLLVNGVFIGAGIADLEIFKFNGKRLSLEFFTTLGEDFIQQAGQVILYYWPIAIIIIGAFVFVWWVDQKIAARLPERVIPIKLSLPLTIILLALGFVAIRGGLQLKSIHIQSAFVQGANELGHLTLNTPYHFLRTFNSPKTPIKKWFTPDELQSRLLALNKSPSYPGQKNHNIVLIILESFSLEYVEEGYAPFLKELASDGLYFERHFANGRRSIEVLSSIFDSIPSVQEVPFSKSSAQGMRLEGLATKLRDHNYFTAFFHGAARGSMGFESYALSHGVKKYYSREDYHGPKEDFDGHWGIYDGPFLQFSLEKMASFSTPFFSGIFTLSSHQPYSVPERLHGKYPKGKLEIHESIGYVDDELKNFFARAKTAPWYKNTLFIITADHTQKLQSAKFQNSLGLYRVPLILFHPAVSFDKQIAQKTTQHLDIAKTALDFLDISEAGMTPLGESVFINSEGQALQFLQPGWQYVKGTRVVQWVEDGEVREYQWNFQNGDLSPVEPTGLEIESKLYLQYLFNGFRANKWPFVLRE